MADGNYITLANTKKLLARVLSVYGADDDHLTLIVEASEGMVNAALASRYTIPVTGSEAVNYIRSLVVPIMRYKTWTQFADQEEFPEGVLEEYKSTMKELDKLAKRTTSLPNVDDKTTGRAAYIKVSTTASQISTF